MKKFLIALSMLAFSVFCRAESDRERVDFDYIGSFYLGTPVMVGDFPALEMSRSASFFYDLCHVKVGLDSDCHINIRAAVRYCYNNIAFRKAITFVEEEGLIYPEPLTVTGLKKSKLNLSYISLPLGIDLRFGKFELGLNYSADFLIRAKSKYKFSDGKIKTDLYDGLNSFVNTAEIVCSYDGIGFVVNYGMTPIIESGSWYDDARVVSFGVVLGF